MRPPAIPRGILVLGLFVLLAAVLGPLPAPAARPLAAGEQVIVVVKDGGTMRLVNSATGADLWKVAAFATAALGPDSTLYLGVDRGGRTDVIAFAPGDAEPTLISDRAPAGALAVAVAAAGDRLWLLTYDYDDVGTRNAPTALITVSLPADEGKSAGRLRAYRDNAGGILLRDASRWYGHDWRGDRLVLVEVRFQDGKPLTETPLSVPIGSSLLLSPGGARLYVISHLRQTISVIDTASRQIVHTLHFDRRRSKAPDCADVLSPGGSRLYHIAFDGNTPLGIEVFETTSLERVGRFFPGRDFYCLAISPDGKRLYADTDDALVTIDAATGEELASVPLKYRGPVPPNLLLATSAS